MATDPIVRVFLRRAIAAFLALGAAAFPAAGQASSPSQSLGGSDAGERFAVAGVAIGSPGYVNLVAGYYFPRLVVRASGGYYRRDMYGAQGDVGLRLVSHPGFSLGVSAIAGAFGTSAEEDDSTGATVQAPRRQDYTGLALDLYLSRFLLQTGIAYGFRSTPPNPQLIVQVGYLMDFRRRAAAPSARASASRVHHD